MPHIYQVLISPLDDHRAPAGPALSFETSNHDDLFTVLDKLRVKALVPDEETPSLAVGLKLFSESLIRHRGTPPFDTLWPHMAAFIKALKATPTAHGQD